MANVKDDEFETLDFADEAEYADGDSDEDEDEPQDGLSAAVEALRDEVEGLDLTDGERSAFARLMDAVAGLDLTEAEKRTLGWLMRWDPSTVDNVASMIEKARAA